MDAIIERYNQWTYIDFDQAVDDGESLNLYFLGSWEFIDSGPFNVYLFRLREFNLAFLDCYVEEVFHVSDEKYNTSLIMRYTNKGSFTDKSPKELQYLFDLLDFFKENEEKLDERTASPIWT